jgi:hypothetical protein
MNGEARRARRAAFCYWIGDSLLAAAPSAVGGMIGDFIFPLFFPLILVPLVFGFLEGLVIGAIVRIFAGKLPRYTLWLFAWFVFGFGAAVLRNYVLAYEIRCSI